MAAVSAPTTWLTRRERPGDGRDDYTRSSLGARHGHFRGDPMHRLTLRRGHVALASDNAKPRRGVTCAAASRLRLAPPRRTTSRSVRARAQQHRQRRDDRTASSGRTRLATAAEGRHRPGEPVPGWVSGLQADTLNAAFDLLGDDLSSPRKDVTADGTIVAAGHGALDYELYISLLHFAAPDVALSMHGLTEAEVPTCGVHPDRARPDLPS